MRNYYVDTCKELREIFMEHCNLSMEQYEEISGRLMDLVTEIQETDEDGCGTFAEAYQKAEELGVIFEFLLNTKEVTLAEYNDMYNLVNRIRDDAWMLENMGMIFRPEPVRKEAKK